MPEWVRNAVAKAREAVASPACGALPVENVLRGFRNLLVGRADDLVSAIERERPRMPGDTIAAEVLPLALACRFLEKNAARLLRPRFVRSGLLDLFLGRISIEVRREPLGVVLVIGPSNYPLFLPGAQALQALAAGNAVMVKPGLGGKAVMDLMAGLLADAGLAPGRFTVLGESAAEGTEAIGAGADKVVLTGSLATGRSVLSALAASATPSVMELSGCDAVFVLDGADLELAASAVAFGMRLNSGATCMGPHRIFVPARIEEEFAASVASKLDAIGALAVPERIAGAARLLAREAVSAGARLVRGSIEEGSPFTPVLLTSCRAGMGLMKSDVFAPVAGTIPVESPEQALELSRLCPFALSSSVFGPRKDADKFARRVRAGSVVVNDMIAPTAHPDFPFGGLGSSGFGVTRGAEGLLEMTAVKVIAVSRGGRLPHLDLPGPASGAIMRRLLEYTAGEGLLRRVRALIDLVRLAKAAKPMRK